MENKEEQKEVSEGVELNENTSNYEEKYLRNIDKDTLIKEMDKDEEYLSNEEDNYRYPTESDVEDFTYYHKNEYKSLNNKLQDDFSKEDLRTYYINKLPEVQQNYMRSLEKYDIEKYESIFNDDSSESKPKVKRLVKNYEDDYVKRR